jgi:hypothetical protein
MIYLASPYWHDDPDIRAIRARENADAAARLAVRGFFVFAPVVHGHAIAELDPFHDIQTVYWIEHGLDMLERCDAMWVLGLVGWRQSEGVAGEVLAARALDMDVHLLDYTTFDLTALPANYTPAAVLRNAGSLEKLHLVP